MIQNVKYRLLFFCAFLLAACETVVDVEIPDKPPLLVVNSFFATDSTWKVHLSKSQHILDNALLSTVDDATVVIKDASENSITLIRTASGVYEAQQNPLPMKTYTLNAMAPGFEAVSASDYIPNVVPIVRVDTGRITDMGEMHALFTLYFDDPGQEQNYYKIQVHGLTWDYIYSDTSWLPVDSFSYKQKLDFTTKDWGQEKNKGYDWSTIYFNDNLFNGQSYSIQLLLSDYQLYSWGEERQLLYDQLLVELYSVSKEYYLFYSSFSKHTQARNDPFAQPAQVYNNINKGYGIFAGYGSSKYQVPLK